MIIKMLDYVGDYGENKDIARRLRIKEIMPALLDGEVVILDFDGVSGATQSFIHALIVMPMREFGDKFFELVSFRNCSATIKQVVQIVSEYTQEGMASEG